MAISENLRITLKVCRLYYEDNLSQKEISAKLGISRPQISRILSYAKENHIVTININNPYSNESVLEEKLVKIYGLTDAIVINTDGVKNTEQSMAFAEKAANDLESFFFDGNHVGVMSGKTVSNIVQNIRWNNKRNLEFIPLVGGIGPVMGSFHANVIAALWAQITMGNSAVLNVPFIVKNEKSCEILKREPEIENILKKGSLCDVALVGIGQIDVESTTAQAGALDSSDIKVLKAQGAMASVCNSYLDKNGKLIKASIMKRSIGVSLDQMKGCRIIAAARGISKTKAIDAALRSGYIDVLITDTETAHLILENNKDNEGGVIK